MNLFEYIKSQLPSMPNVAIMKDMGASDELIEYIRHTTWNTNLGMLAAYGCEPSGGGTDTVTITLLDGSDAYIVDCDTFERISSPHKIVTPSGVPIALPETDSKEALQPGIGWYSFWSRTDGGGEDYEPCTEYEFSEDITLYANGRIERPSS